MYVNEIAQRCPGCMRPLNENPVCSACGTSALIAQAPPFLPLRTLLAQGRYGVGVAVEQNGDGITYLGYDAQARKPVYIREFYPAAIALREGDALAQSVMQGCEIVWRDCAQNFMELWRKLQRLRGLSALLAVTDVFEENGTIYAVYEYAECMTLREFLLRGKLGYISWERARALLMPVLSTLGSLHQQGIIHRGISPNTLYFGADGKVRIGGFSIWQARTAHGDLTAELTDGYAALEQYGLEDQQGAWTDIYAFSAVLYRSLIGSDPDDAVSRRHNDRVMVPAHFAERIPAYVINALINAMQVFPDDRTRTVDQLRAELSASPTAAAQSSRLATLPRVPQATTVTVPRVQENKPPANKAKATGGAVAARTAAIILGIGLAAAVAVMAIWFREPFLGLFTGQVQTTAATTVQMIEVPNFAGELFSDDLKKEYAGRLAITVRPESSQTAPEDEIIRQSVSAGTKVALGSEVVLTVSSGWQEEVVPPVLGKSISKARTELEELGFVVTEKEMPNDSGKKAGTVKSVYPEEGMTLAKGSELFVQVWGPASSAATTEAATTTGE